MSNVKRAELRSRTLAPREVSDLRAIHAQGSARDLLALVERIVTDHEERAFSKGKGVPRDASAACTCGMAEQERTGHCPQHADWCEVAGPDGFAE